jgi:hypothetical protein
VDAAVAVSTSSPPRAERFAGWGGIAFVVLFLAGVILAGDPGTKDGTKIANHFADHRTAILVGMWLAGIGLLSFAAWAWSLRDTFARLGEEGLAAALLAAGVLTAAVEFPVVALFTSLAFMSDQAVDPGVARAIYDTAQVFSYVDWFPLALFLAAFAGAVRRTRLVAAWLGWSAAVLAVLSLGAAPPTFGLDLGVSVVVFVWIILVTVLLRTSPPRRTS